MNWLFNALAIRRAGGRPVRLVPGGRPSPRLDALVIGGGEDISAVLYGGNIDPDARFDDQRDSLELAMLDIAEAAGMPILAIGRGAQMLNVHRGGSLHQEISRQWPEAPRGRVFLPRRRVRIIGSSRLGRLFDERDIKVNSIHHQAIGELGEGLRIGARDDFGIVQGIEAAGRERFVLGVQWHPELLPLSPSQQRLFQGLVAAARRHMALGAERGMAAAVRRPA